MAEKYGTNIYITGGYNGYSMLKTCLGYDPLSGGGQFWSIASMPIIRSGHDICTDGRYLYTLGGYDGEPLLRYDPIVNMWTSTYQLQPAPTDRIHLRLVYLDGKIYATGGSTISSSMFDIVEIYDIASDSWTPGESLPVPVCMHGTAVYEGDLYVFGGMLNGGSLTDTMFKYEF